MRGIVLAVSTHIAPIRSVWQGTFSNYLGHLRTACLALDVPMPPADHPAVARAKTSIVKRMLFSPKPRMFLQRTMVRNIFLSVERGLETLDMAMLWLTSYLFLLRVPSEALPMVRGNSVWAQCNQSTLYLDEEGKLCLRLQTRKNRPGGSLLRRSCACAACPKICPVHVVWLQFFAKLPLGAAPWKDVTPDKARSRLRATLTKLGVSNTVCCCTCCGPAVGWQVPNSHLFGTHDLRRGHAKACRVGITSPSHPCWWRCPCKDPCCG